MEDEFSRSRLLLGRKSIDLLKKTRIAVFGVGGVGGFAVEALARTGVGRFILVDNDVVTITNLNRQIIATHSSIGRKKVEVMRERILDINPLAEIEIYDIFYLPDMELGFLERCDYLIDAIDTVAGKLGLAKEASQRGIPMISSMGAGNKLDPTRFEVADIYETSVCPLCRAMRHQLRKNGIEKLKVIYSREPPASQEETLDCGKLPGRKTTGSVAYIPSVAGLVLASEVIRDLTQEFWPGKQSICES